MHRNPEEVTQAIEEALQSEGLVLTRETDLEMVGLYLRSQQHAILHVVIEDGSEDISSDIECTFARTPMGEYIIQWNSESIEDVLTNGKTYLQPSVDSPGFRFVAEGARIYFTSVREVFFGETKVFIVCAPASTEVVRGDRS